MTADGFSSVANPQFISSKTFLAEWEQTVLGSGLRWPRLVEAVRNLWHAFNAGRYSLRGDYMDDESRRWAYLAAFLLPNVQRSYVIWRKPEVVAEWRARFKGKERVRILDFGAGPLSATAGLLFALAENDVFGPNLTIEVVTVERNLAIVEAGWRLLCKACGPRVWLDHVPVSHESELEGEFDIVIAANFFNEETQGRRIRISRAMVQHLAPQGFFFILEPGQDCHARALGTLRDMLLEDNADLVPLAPCFHRSACPLAEGAGRADWCWFQLNWTPPPLLQKLDEAVGLRHNELNYSFVVLARGGECAAGKARVVSDPIVLTEEHVSDPLRMWMQRNAVPGSQGGVRNLLKQRKGIQKSLLCTSEGTLEAALSARGEGVLRRGTDVDLSAVIRCLERQKGPKGG